MTFEIGDIVKIPDETATYRVTTIYENGDIGCWGGLAGHAGVQNTVGHAQFRAFKPEQLRKVKK